MAFLKADIEKIKKAATLLDQVGPELQDIQSKVNVISNELDNTWDGAASQYYVSKLRSHNKPLQNVKQAVEGFEDYAKTTAQQLQAIDDWIQGIMDLFHFDFSPKS